MREPRWVDVDGASLPLLTFGDPGGPPAFVLPGLSDGLAPLSDPRAAAAVPPPPRVLRDHHVHVLSYRHPVPAAPTTLDLAADVSRVIERLANDPVLLAGHSMGAMVAQHVASDRPDLVAGLVMSATVPRADHELVAVVDRWESLLTAGRWRDFYLDALRVSYTGSDLLRRRLQLRLHAAPALDGLLDRHLALSHACRTHDATDGLPTISVPTLVLAGEQDPLARPERARELAHAIPAAELHVLPGLAHGFPEQARRRYVRLLTGFVRDLPRVPDPPPTEEPA